MSHFKAKPYRTFSSPKPVYIPFERSEASPIPFAVLAACETRMLSKEASLLEVITLGCFLIATVASLRFRDLLRTKPDSVSVQKHILRGISWRTRTSVSGVSGQPWGVCCLGFETRPSTGHWVFRFLETLQLGIDKSRENWGTNWPPDFLLPSWTDAIYRSQLLVPITMISPISDFTANVLGSPRHFCHQSVSCCRST